MLNFRKLKTDFPSAILKEGRTLYDSKMVLSAKIVHLNTETIRLNCRVLGSFDNVYESEIEIHRSDSIIIDSDCHCPYQYDCQHIAAVLFYLEEHLNEILIEYSKEMNLEEAKEVDEEEKQQLRVAFEQAQSKETVRKGKKFDRELLREYIDAAQVLGKSPFFHAEEIPPEDHAELLVLFAPIEFHKDKKNVEFQLALRLPYRSKPLQIQDLPAFFHAVRYHEPLYISSRRLYLTLSSFDSHSAQVLEMLIQFSRFPEKTGEKHLRTSFLSFEDFGSLLAEVYENLRKQPLSSLNALDDEVFAFPGLFVGTLDEPIKFSLTESQLRFEIEFLEIPAPKILLKPTILLHNGKILPLESSSLFPCSLPGVVDENTYYRFPNSVKRKHLQDLEKIRDAAIPEPLFGTFLENSLPQLLNFSEVANQELVERFVTLPFVEPVRAECHLHYLKGELEASLSFVYGDVKIPAADKQLKKQHIMTFLKQEGILARNLTEEQKILDDLFQDFQYDEDNGIYIAKTDKKIVEFMTGVIPRYQDRVSFHCPENLLDHFIYDQTTFTLDLRETKQIDQYEVDLRVDGDLSGVTLDLLWECLSTKRAFIELSRKNVAKKGRTGKAANTAPNKILVLDLEKLAPVVQVFDEIGIQVLDTHKEIRPLWSLTSIDAASFEGLPIQFMMTDKLKHIQQQMLGNVSVDPKPLPKSIQATLRPYQMDGVHWIDRLRGMHLNGVLADDMGLGKTLQAIISITQYKEEHPKAVSLVVCPTSLVYNWREEFYKFNPKLKVMVVDGTPAQRKKILEKLQTVDVLVTSYSLLQKDIDTYQKHHFGYAILDEAHYIKNRGTRNAKSVKMIHSTHRLVLTGTPIENSLDELWSLFDFLMPGLLSSYDRFIEKYVRNPNRPQALNLEALRRKLTPFILRRMKKEVLQELPDVSEIVYHCDLSDVQRELYRSYANSAREELSQLVKKEGFDRIQIHVLATLTRLKQICCHPAIFAKEKAENGDSAKYDMLIELLQTLMEGGHKTVIFSQYTRMLNIIREDLQRMGVRFEYLDGSSKNRTSIVKKFNDDQTIPVFLVSLKAGGTGLNLTGADTVIHYDMWWNPAVENQATDRVHRIGQKNAVSSYKLVTLNTIEEKILELQARKKGLVTSVVNCDSDAIAKLTWEEVLDLLKT